MNEDVISPRKCGCSVNVGYDYICTLTCTPCKLLYRDEACVLENTTSALEKFSKSILREVEE